VLLGVENGVHVNGGVHCAYPAGQHDVFEVDLEDPLDFLAA